MAWTTPKTWTVGSAGTSSDLNTYIRDNTNFLYGDTAWTAVSAFANSWVNSGAPYFNAAYRKAGTRVFLRGMIKSGTGGATAFTLPSGYRPTSNVRGGGDSNAGWASCVIDTTGNVIPTPTAPTFFSIDLIAFDTI